VSSAAYENRPDWTTIQRGAASPLWEVRTRAAGLAARRSHPKPSGRPRRVTPTPPIWAPWSRLPRIAACTVTAARLYKQASGHGSLSAATRLVSVLRAMHPGDQRPAAWAAANVSLDDPDGMALLLDALRIILSHGKPRDRM